ncbi:hypothetical protein [Roseococcus sp. SYP-B2431]|uniref:hypothetical protein n=1 Tax=Roseococcus sp. SYP-B2431 TaxID=2496640 RepID=UPI0013F42ADC|nr:hypothetical protein [Roseococcus sp. SYP-B2431]
MQSDPIHSREPADPIDGAMTEAQRQRWAHLESPVAKVGLQEWQRSRAAALSHPHQTH